MPMTERIPADGCRITFIKAKRFRMKKIILTAEEQKQLDAEEKKSFIEERKRILKERGKDRAKREDEDIFDAGKRVLKNLFK